MSIIREKPLKIAIIGYSGTGKSAAGVKIAEKLALSFADLDEIIVYKQGMSIAQTYITFGEKTFRSLEEGALSEVLWHDDIVICVGGGLPLNSCIMELLQDFVKVRFTAGAHTIHARLTALNRPKIWDYSLAAIKKAIAEREETYSFYADITIDTDGKTVEEVAELVVSGQ